MLSLYLVYSAATTYVVAASFKLRCGSIQRCSVDGGRTAVALATSPRLSSRPARNARLLLFSATFFFLCARDACC